MEKNIKFYFKLFKSTFLLSAFTFGGGYVIVPLMRKKFVEELAWIEENEMLDLIAIAQSAPGVIAVNTSILVGYRLAGIMGAIITTFGTVLPPLITLSIISMFYKVFRESEAAQYILKGLQAGVAAVIVDVILKMIKDIIKEKKLYANFIMIVSFILAYFLNINLIIIIVFFGICGALSMYLYKNK